MHLKGNLAIMLNIAGLDVNLVTKRVSANKEATEPRVPLG